MINGYWDYNGLPVLPVGDVRTIMISDKWVNFDLPNLLTAISNVGLTLLF